MAGVLSLMRLQPLIQTVRLSRVEGGLAALTAALTIACAPHLEYGVIVGVGLSLVVQVVRGRTLRMRPEFVREDDGDLVRCRPQGALWFGSVAHLQDCFGEVLRSGGATRYELACEGLVYTDLSGAVALQGLVAQGEARGVVVQIRGARPQLTALLEVIRGDL